MLHILDAFFLQILLRLRNGSRRGILPYVIKEADLLCVGVCGEDQVHHRRGVQIVGSSGDIRPGRFQRVHQPHGNGVGNRCKDHGDVVFFGSRLHGHGNRRRHTHHQIHVVGDEVCDDLTHQVRIGVAVIIVHLEGDALLLADGLQLCFDVINDLVQ